MLKEMVELHKLNKQWFEANKHLTNEEMLDAGLIDGCDLIWVDYFRGEKNEVSVV